jgi:hypothetical protein
MITVSLSTSFSSRWFAERCAENFQLFTYLYRTRPKRHKWNAVSWSQSRVWIRSLFRLRFLLTVLLHGIKVIHDGSRLDELCTNLILMHGHLGSVHVKRFINVLGSHFSEYYPDIWWFTTFGVIFNTGKTGKIPRHKRNE